MRKSTPEGDAGATCSGMLVLKAGLRCPSAYPGTSSSCYLFSISGIKSQQKAQDVGCSQPFGALQLLSEVLLGENLWRYLLSLYPLSSSVYHLYLSHIPPGGHLLRNSSPEVSRPVPTVSCCHLATSDHLEIYPTIKSFSRNPALQT